MDEEDQIERVVLSSCTRGGGGGGGGAGGGGVKCGRWNPTAEQVKVLMDLFRAGLRTPSTEQIQKITSQLSCYGKIESKNVFYWFQNHKARERHHKKRRRGGGGGGDSAWILNPSCKREIRSCLMGEQVEVSWERHEREVETLELFPLKSYDLELHKVAALRNNEWKELPFLDAAAGGSTFLDLRLSFL